MTTRSMLRDAGAAVWGYIISTLWSNSLARMERNPVTHHPDLCFQSYSLALPTAPLMPTGAERRSINTNVSAQRQRVQLVNKGPMMEQISAETLRTAALNQSAGGESGEQHSGGDFHV